MKIYHFSITGDTNSTYAFKSKKEAEREHRQQVANAKDDTSTEVLDIHVSEFQISAKGVLKAFQSGADQAPY